MNYAESMSGMDQLFAALLGQQQQQPTTAVVDEMGEPTQANTQGILEELLQGQQSDSQRRLSELMAISRRKKKDKGASEEPIIGLT